MSELAAKCQTSFNFFFPKNLINLLFTTFLLKSTLKNLKLTLFKYSLIYFFFPKVKLSTPIIV